MPPRTSGSSGVARETGNSGSKESRRAGWLGLAAVVIVFLAVEWMVPLRTTVQIGADEGFELAKATLCLKGHRLYSEVWNDQPPLHTWVVTQVLKHVSGSVLGPRLITVGFAVVLLVSLFGIIRRVSGPVAAVVGTALLVGSPGFIELSSSCMLEIPSLATAMAALWVLSSATTGRKIDYLLAASAGVLFGLALLLKLVPVVLLPLGLLMLVFQVHGP
jgi:4-amino-4-deoxy-L-arabinose transferase-like glycosyltransferase